MVGLNKNILRISLMLSYILIITLIVYGISALYSYLNTGADRSTMLHTEIKNIDQYLPKIEWATLANEGRHMDTQTLSDIEHDYIDAWYVKHLAYKTNLTQGINDYYTESARENMFDIIDLNRAAGTTIEATSLEHHPILEFFSEDGQLVVITDNNVVEYKRIYKAGILVLETTELSSYKLILLLEDGFWRIRHMVKLKAQPYKNEIVNTPVKNLNIQGINYYPQATPWNMFGNEFNARIISKDFKIIKEAGLNSIRVFVPYDDFGKANVSEEKLKKLIQILDIANTNDLKVIITLFDFYGDYSVLDWTLNQRHTESIVSALKNHKALLAWDIKNEPNLDFKTRGKNNVIAWLSSMIDLIKSMDTEHPVTIGWSDAQSAVILKDKLDFISFHYYENLNDLEQTFQELKTIVLDKPVAITEFGISSYKGFWNFFGSSEEAQAEYHKKAQDLLKVNNIQYMSWTLYDFIDIPNEVTGRLPWRKKAQKYFGFIDKNNNQKKAFKYLSH